MALYQLPLYRKSQRTTLFLHIVLGSLLSIFRKGQTERQQTNITGLVSWNKIPLLVLVIAEAISISLEDDSKK